MTVVYACIAPHGGEIVPELTGSRAGPFSPTTKGMRKLAAQLDQAKPETVVVASPHNLRLSKHLGVVLSENSSGKVTEGRRSIGLKARCDLELGARVLAKGEELGLPVVGANYGALEGPASDLQMDWGTLIPLWFFMRRGRSRRKVLIVTPSRGIPLDENFSFGRAIGLVAEASGHRVAFVASADQAHAHRKDGPYGFSPRAAEYDEKVVAAVKENRLASLMRLESELVEAAKPDSLWQTTMLAGVLDVVAMKGEFVSYQAPTYFGMMCAGYRRLS